MEDYLQEPACLNDRQISNTRIVAAPKDTTLMFVCLVEILVPVFSPSTTLKQTLFRCLSDRNVSPHEF